MFTPVHAHSAHSHTKHALGGRGLVYAGRVVRESAVHMQLTSFCSYALHAGLFCNLRQTDTDAYFSNTRHARQESRRPQINFGNTKHAGVQT